MNAPARAPVVAPSFPRGLKKPSPESARRVYLVAWLVVLASAGFGVIAQDMRPLVAAIYFAFGFVMQRGTFCSAALISAVVLSRDNRGLIAIMIAVLTAMLGLRR